MNNEKERVQMTPEEKRIRLYLEQKELLEEFLRHGAITQAQYKKSLGDLTEKMKMKNYCEEVNK